MTVLKSNFVILSQDPGAISLAVFKTELGWFGVLHCDEVVRQLKFGFSSRKETMAYFDKSASDSKRLGTGQADCKSPATSPTPALRFDRVSKSIPVWENAFTQYAAGQKISFGDVQVDISGLTEFQIQVLKKCRAIPYGKVLTYGELAEKSGSVGAARAVGSAMKSNRVPIVVPCHRVVGANGLGGFSASQGVSTKERLLQMEGALKKPQQMLPGLGGSN